MARTLLATGGVHSPAGPLRLGVALLRSGQVLRNESIVEAAFRQAHG